MNIFSRASKLAQELFVAPAQSIFTSVTSKGPEQNVGCWYRAIDASGKPAGFAFECPVCHFGIKHHAPRTVFHCGNAETLSQPVEKLKERRLVNMGDLNKRFLDTDEGGFDGNFIYEPYK